VSFVEESGDHRLFIAAALLEDGRLRHVHRKIFLPTYGLFDERRFFAQGDLLRAVPSRLGVGVGLAVCEDFWHLGVPRLLALDGAQILVNVSSSPGRDLASTNEVGLGTATSWRTLMRTYAQLTTSFVVFCNRVGVDESISFWGGSEVIAPTGDALLSAPLYDEGLFMVDVDLGAVRRERIALPLLRDERPELEVRELGRIVAERAGLAADSTAEDGAEAGLDVSTGVPNGLPGREPAPPVPSRGDR
jgi:predicted amidohydrolase